VLVRPAIFLLHGNLENLEDYAVPLIGPLLLDVVPLPKVNASYGLQMTLIKLCCQCAGFNIRALDGRPWCPDNWPEASRAVPVNQRILSHQQPHECALGSEGLLRLPW